MAVALMCAAAPASGATDADLQRAARQAQQAAKRAEQQAAQQARQQQAQADRAARQADSQARRHADARGREAAIAQSCATLQAWLAAGPVPVYAGHIPSDVAVTTLLRDERFVPAFGQRYDDMAPAALQQRAQGAARCFGVPNGLLAALPVRDKQLVHAALSTVQQPLNRQRLARARQADAALLGLASSVQALEPTEADFLRLGDMAREAQGLFAIAAPTARASFVEAMRAADSTVAVPVLSAAVETALATAQGVDGLQQLAGLADRQQVAVLPGVERLQSSEGMQARKANADRIQGRMATLGEALAQAERNRIDALGQGTVALEQGVRWHADYLERLQPHVVRAPALAQVLPYFLEKRLQALADAQDALQRDGGAAASHEQLQGLQSRYLLAQDAQTVPGTAIQTRFIAQAQALDKRLALGRAESGSAAAPAAPQATTDEPSEDVMYDLVRQVLETGTERQNALMNDCRGGLRANDPAMNQVCAVAMLYTGVATGNLSAAATPRILTFEKIGCAPALGQAGYLCDYQLAVEKHLNPAFVGPQAKRLLEGASLKQARFVQGRRGWMMIYTDEAVQ